MEAISRFFNSAYLDAFGFHSNFISSPDAQWRVLRSIPDQSYFTHNLNNIAGYIPLVGMVGGVRHVINGNGDFSATTARGCAEIAFCGPILFVIDILVTLGRLFGKALLFFSDKMNSRNEPPVEGSQPVEENGSQESMQRAADSDSNTPPSPASDGDFFHI